MMRCSIIACVWLWASPALAATYYVATDGDDGRSCMTAQTIGTPKATITDAQTCLTPGDTLYVRGGTYVEDLQFTTPTGTNWTTGLVSISAYPGETVWLAPNDTAPWGTAVEFSFGQQYIEFDGININGAGIISDAIKIDNFNDGSDHLAHHIRIKNATLKNMPGFGVVVSALLAGSIGYNEFQNLTITCEVAYAATCNIVGGAFTHLIYLQTSFNLVEYCNLSDAGGNGIEVRSDDFDTASNNIIRYNTVHDIYRDNTDGRHRGIIISSSNDNAVIGNVVYNISSPVIGMNENLTAAIENVYAQRTLIYNNTTYNGNWNGIASYGDITSGTIIQNNIAYGFNVDNFHDETNYGGGKTLTQDHNVFASDPLFRDAGSANFQLLAGSPALNAGTDLSAVFTIDLTGANRPQGGAFDIGALELLGGRVTRYRLRNIF